MKRGKYMNTALAFLFVISLIFIPVCIVLALIKIVRKKSPKKTFILAGGSALVCIVSFVGFGFTMDELPVIEKQPHEESSYIAMETTYPKQTAIPTLEPTATPTPKPTATPTPEPTATPTPKPTAAPTPEPTATPTLEPTATPTPKPTATPTPEPTATPTPKPTAAPTPEPTAIPTQEPTMAPIPENPSADSTDGGSGNNNFDTYDNPEQQQTKDDYVLNTSSMKIHYPSCRSVAKIAPKNYATSNESLDSLLAQGYDTCGICFK